MANIEILLNAAIVTEAVRFHSLRLTCCFDIALSLCSDFSSRFTTF
jgi:hypothetical protein